MLTKLLLCKLIAITFISFSQNDIKPPSYVNRNGERNKEDTYEKSRASKRRRETKLD